MVEKIKIEIDAEDAEILVDALTVLRCYIHPAHSPNMTRQEREFRKQRFARATLLQERIRKHTERRKDNGIR